LRVQIALFSSLSLASFELFEKTKNKSKDINELSDEKKLEELRNTFEYFDKDGSDEISIDEVRCALNAFGFFPSEAFLQ